MLLAMTSPLLAIGLVMLLQVFETWALGPSRPEHHSRQPHRPSNAPSASGQSLPADRSQRPDACGLRPGALWASPPALLTARASACGARGSVGAGRRHTMPLHVITTRSGFITGHVERPVDVPGTIHGSAGA